MISNYWNDTPTMPAAKLSSTKIHLSTPVATIYTILESVTLSTSKNNPCSIEQNKCSSLIMILHRLHRSRFAGANLLPNIQYVIFIKNSLAWGLKNLTVDISYPVKDGDLKLSKKFRACYVVLTLKVWNGSPHPVHFSGALTEASQKFL